MFNQYQFNEVRFNDNGNSQSFAFPPSTSDAWLKENPTDEVEWDEETRLTTP